MKLAKEMAIKEGTEYITMNDLVVTVKTTRFLAELEGVKSIVSKSALPKATSEYLLTFKQRFAEELTVLPQLAALFHNDCLLFVSKSREFGCHDTHVASVEEPGHASLGIPNDAPKARNSRGIGGMRRGVGGSKLEL